MKILSITAALFFFAGPLSALSIGAYLTTASYSMTATLDDRLGPGSTRKVISAVDVCQLGLCTPSPDWEGIFPVAVDGSKGEEVTDKGHADAQMFATAYASIGSAHASVTGTFHVSTSGPNQDAHVSNLEVSAIADWRDFVTVSSAQASGRELVLQAALVLTGDVNTFASGQGGGGSVSAAAYITSNWRLPVFYPDSPTRIARAFQNVGGTSNDTGAQGALPIFLTVPEGSGTDMIVTLQVRGTGLLDTALGVENASVVAGFSGDYSNTLKWGGITSVTDAQTGELITDWTIASESGFDYSRPYPVPEPSSLVSLGSCLSILLAQRRRRK